jgi:hypothetical protein
MRPRLNQIYSKEKKRTETHSFRVCVNYIQYWIKCGCSKFVPEYNNIFCGLQMKSKVLVTLCLLSRDG